MDICVFGWFVSKIEVVFEVFEEGFGVCVVIVMRASYIFYCIVVVDDEVWWFGLFLVILKDGFYEVFICWSGYFIDCIVRGYDVICFCVLYVVLEGFEVVFGKVLDGDFCVEGVVVEFVLFF